MYSNFSIQGMRSHSSAMNAWPPHAIPHFVKAPLAAQPESCKVNAALSAESRALIGIIAH